MIHITLHDSKRIRDGLQLFEQAIEPFKARTVYCMVNKDAETIELVIEQSLQNPHPDRMSLIAGDHFQESLISFRAEQTLLHS